MPDPWGAERAGITHEEYVDAANAAFMQFVDETHRQAFAASAHQRRQRAVVESAEDYDLCLLLLFA